MVPSPWVHIVILMNRKINQDIIRVLLVQLGILSWMISLLNFQVRIIVTSNVLDVREYRGVLDVVEPLTLLL